MRSDQVFAGQLVDSGGQALGQPPGVDEDDGRAVLADQLEDAWVDRRPDAAPRPLLLRADHRGRPAVHFRSSLEVGHVIDRDLDRDLQLLHAAGVDDAYLSIRPAQETRRLAKRPLRCRETNPLYFPSPACGGGQGGGSTLQLRQAFQAQR